MTLQAGTKLRDRYEVVRAITSGGMGSIYEARDLQLNGRRVALKQMLEHLMEGDQAALFRSKFQSEVTFLRTLQHPGIPQAYDSFIYEGVYYIVMEFIIGRNLEQELEERLQLTGQPFSVDQIIRDTRQVLDILIYLHAQDPPLVHRDIKPANLIREHPSGRIRLVDFGMARLLSDGSKTQTQLGTLGYSPLEQMQGKAEQRSDIYALGATLHHLVTGVLPTALNIPPVHQLKPDLDPATAAIIDRACAHELNIRFSSAKEMLRAIDELRPHLPMVLEAPVRLRPLPQVDGPPEASIPKSATFSRAMPLDPQIPFGQEVAPPVPTEPSSETEKMGPLARRPEAFRWTFMHQVAVIGLLSALAFLFGLGIGHGPDETVTPTSTPTSMAVLPEIPPSPLPVAVASPSAEPLPPVATPTPKPTPKATPKPIARPKPVPKPVPEETPESFPLTNGPSYPTANQTGTPHETVGLLDSTSHLEVNLDSTWDPIKRIQSQGYFYRSFRKNTGSYELSLDVKGYTMESRGTEYRNSFRAQHTGWTSTTLPGADVAFTTGQGRSRQCQALVLKQGHYYWVSLHGKGAGMNSQIFQDELTKAWQSLNIID